MAHTLNIIVFGLGHSGTSLVSRLLEALGWNLPRAEDEFAEHVDIRDVSFRCINHGEPFDYERAWALVESLREEEPWVLKDPRFVELLPQWCAVFRKVYPSMPHLLWVQRNPEDLKHSYLKRGLKVGDQPGVRGRSIDQLLALAQRHYREWPGTKRTIHYEHICKAKDAQHSRPAPS